MHRGPAAPRMNRGIFGFALPVLVWMGVGAAHPPSAPHPPLSMLPDTASVLDGVFTAGQAERGKDVFEVTCMRCHALADFTAGPHAPTKKWSNVGDLFKAVSTKMPFDDPGTLSYPEYAAVVSYILQQNGYPARSVELSTDARKLVLIRIVPMPGPVDSVKLDGMD